MKPGQGERLTRVGCRDTTHLDRGTFSPKENLSGREVEGKVSDRSRSGDPGRALVCEWGDGSCLTLPFPTRRGRSSGSVPCLVLAYPTTPGDSKTLVPYFRTLETRRHPVPHRSSSSLLVPRGIGVESDPHFRSSEDQRRPPPCVTLYRSEVTRNFPGRSEEFHRRGPVPPRGPLEPESRDPRLEER